MFNKKLEERIEELEEEIRMLTRSEMLLTRKVMEFGGIQEKNERIINALLDRMGLEYVKVEEVLRSKPKNKKQ